MSTKEFIIDKAFEVFMDRGYESTSITVLQKELGLSRGAMYRHFKSKEDLLRVVIDKYALGLIEFVKNGLIDGNSSLLEMAEKYIQLMEVFFRAVSEITDFNTKFLNYTSLCIAAARVDPEFGIALKTNNFTLRQAWKKAINVSIDRGEIRDDVNVDILAGIFHKSLHGAESSNDNSLLTEIRQLKQTVIYIYSLIKI